MPIRVPDSLPAAGVLESENIFVMTQRRALHQDIRPLNLLILNLMPTKIVTETQLLRKAREAGLKTFNGMYMLLYQGAAAFKLWTGQEMPVEQIKAKYFSKA